VGGVIAAQISLALRTAKRLQKKAIANRDNAEASKRRPPNEAAAGESRGGSF